MSFVSPSEAQNASPSPAPLTLLDLPDTLLQEILSRSGASVLDRLKLAHICRTFRQLALESGTLWRTLNFARRDVDSQPLRSFLRFAKQCSHMGGSVASLDISQVLTSYPGRNYTRFTWEGSPASRIVSFAPVGCLSGLTELRLAHYPDDANLESVAACTQLRVLVLAFLRASLKYATIRQTRKVCARVHSSIERVALSLPRLAELRVQCNAAYPNNPTGRYSYLSCLTSLSALEVTSHLLNDLQPRDLPQLHSLTLLETHRTVLFGRSSPRWIGPSLTALELRGLGVEGDAYPALQGAKSLVLDGCFVEGLDLRGVSSLTSVILNDSNPMPPISGEVVCLKVHRKVAQQLCFLVHFFNGDCGWKWQPKQVCALHLSVVDFPAGDRMDLEKHLISQNGSFIRESNEKWTLEVPGLTEQVGWSHPSTFPWYALTHLSEGYGATVEFVPRG